MYVVYRFGYRVSNGSLNRKFKTYEVARSAVRKRIRKSESPCKNWGDWSWQVYSNPSISLFGYTIKKT